MEVGGFLWGGVVWDGIGWDRIGWEGMCVCVCVRETRSSELRYSVVCM